MSRQAPVHRQQPQPHPPVAPPLTRYNSGRSHHAHAAPHHTHPTPQHKPTRSLFSFLPPSGETQRLYTSKHDHDRDRYEDMASVFSLLTTTERLENMWARRGAIDQRDYEKQCNVLIQQHNALKKAVEKTVPNLDKFIVDYEMKINFAANRLKQGVPATVPTASSDRSKAFGRTSKNCTSSFITLIDSIELKQTEVTTLLPQLTTLTINLDNIKKMISRSRNNDYIDFDITKPLEWRQKLNNMPAHMQLSPEDAAQLKLDLDNTFQEFERMLNDD